MAWVPLLESGLLYEFGFEEFAFDASIGSDSIVRSITSYGSGGSWWVLFDRDAKIRITVASYEFLGGGQGRGAEFWWLDGNGQQIFVENESPSNDSFDPNQFEVDLAGAGNGVNYTSTYFEGGEESIEVLIEVWDESPDPPTPPTPEAEGCEEHGRSTRAYVSGYDRARVHRSRLVRGDRRCLIADFNGAIPLSRRIVSATWRTNQAYASILSDARIVGREVAVDMTAGSGLARIKCVATLDNGEVYSQLFIVRAIGGPWFQGEASPSAGPNELTATAP